MKVKINDMIKDMKRENARYLEAKSNVIIDEKTYEVSVQIKEIQ